MPKSDKAKAPAALEAAQPLERAPTRGMTPIFCLVLVVATLAVFSPAMKNEFVNYDDPDYVTANSHVQGGLNWANISWAFTTGHASNWHPLTWLSHMLDWRLFGNRPAGHHLVSVLFHTANAVLLFLVLLRLTASLWPSALVAALFALHPVHVESVAWISERKDVLSAFFFLLTLGAYACYAGPKARNGTVQPANSRWFWYCLALIFFAFGLMSKPMLVTVPFVLVLLDYWPLSRLAPVGESGPRISRLILEKLPFLLLSAVSSYITFKVQRAGGAVSTSISLGARFANALVAYVRYLGKTVWPGELAVLYPHPGHWPASTVVGAGLLLLLISAAILSQWRRRPFLVVGWLWFCGMLVPTIGIVQVGVQSMADRYTYLPLLGLFIMLAWGSMELLDRWRAVKPALATAAIIALGGLAALSVHQIGLWRTSETLFRHATEVTTGNYLAYNNLGFYLSKDGKIDEAMVNYRKSLEINPRYEDALNNMGFALAAKKRFAEAIAYYDAALKIRPNHAEVHNNLGNALSEVGRIAEAIEHYQITLQQVPEHADAHNNLGIALAMQGKFDQAIEHFHAAIRYKPDYASAHSNLGNAFAVQHKLEQAIGEYQESLKLKPDDAQAHNNLGNALAEKGLLDQAVEHYQRAIQVNGDNPEAHFNLGMALARQGKNAEARGHYQQALKLKPDYAEAAKQLNSLAAPQP